MDNKKAEEEISALITGFILLGMAIPVAIAWVATKTVTFTSYLLGIGILEQSERVVLRLNSDAGLDTGRILIIVGVNLIFINLGMRIISKIRRN